MAGAAQTPPTSIIPRAASGLFALAITRCSDMLLLLRSHGQTFRCSN
jgi:hypothetical protein